MRSIETRFNGCGLKFLDVHQYNVEMKAVYWPTLFYLPIIPFYRATITYREGRVDILNKEKLITREVIATYFFGWILFPLMIAGPVSLGLALILFMDNGFVGTVLFFLGFIWSCICVWRLTSWDFRRRTNIENPCKLRH